MSKNTYEVRRFVTYPYQVEVKAESAHEARLLAWAMVKKAHPEAFQLEFTDSAVENLATGVTELKRWEGENIDE